MKNRLREIRFFRRMNQYQLALLARVHQSRISLAENELIELKPDERERISNALGTRANEIWEIGAENNTATLATGV